jgi:hypothetical protein
MKIGSFDFAIRDAHTAVLKGSFKHQFGEADLVLEVELLKLVEEAKKAIPSPLAQKAFDVILKALA